MSAVAEPKEDFDQTNFNLKVWDEVIDDPFYSSLAHRIETDRLGRILMTPPPRPEHSRAQYKIGRQVEDHIDGGIILTECAISTAQGVRGVDAAWISDIRWEKASGGSALTIAPEICIEVLSKSNTTDEIDEKKQLYFEKGAEEVWVVSKDGRVSFYLRETPEKETASKLCPNFPKVIRYRV